MARTIQTTLAALALLGAPLAHAAPPALDGGLYTGLVMPGPEHELYSVTDALQRRINPGPTLGGRFSVRPISLLAGEGEAHVAFGSVPDLGGATVYAYRAQALAFAPIDLPMDIETFLAAGAGNIGVSSDTDVLGNDVDWTAHVGLGGTLPLANRLALRADVRHLFADRNVALGRPGGHSEILIGVTYRIAPDFDRDEDGVADSRDQCVDQQETMNGYADDDGCPDALASVSLTVLDTEGVPAQDVSILIDGEELGRTDADGRFARDELMPATAITLRGEHFHMERPVETTVNLAEGANDASLEMEWMPGRVRVVTMAEGKPMENAMASFTGPKDVETSPVDKGDQLFFLAPGDWQVLVTADTYGTELVDLSIGPDERSLIVIEMALEPAKVEVTREEVVILQQILFESGSSDIQGGSIDLVREVTGTILANPHIKRIRIEGHTDSQGSASLNRKLSQSRVDSVMAWMVDHGVSEEVLEAKGFGEDEPVASNDTEEGRAQNRRVVFTILEQELTVEAEE